MKTFAIVNRKGGVGKTTTAVNLAYELAVGHRLRVLLVDADGQANATQILLPAGHYAGLGALLRGCAVCYDELTESTDVEGLDVLPTAEDLWALDLEAAGGDRARCYRAIRDMREAVEADGAYDVMVLDCPPNLSAACVSAILAADAVIIPVLSDACSVTGVSELAEQIDSLRSLRPDLRVSGVLVTQWHRSQVVEDAVAYLREAGQVPVYDTVIRRTDKVAESSWARMSVQAWSPWCSAARQEGAEAARSEAEAKAKARLEKAEAGAKAAREKLAKAETDAQQTTARAAELEKRLRTAGSPEIAAFGAYFEQAKDVFNRMSGLLLKLRNTGAEEHDRLADALRSLLEAMLGSLPPNEERSAEEDRRRTE